MPIAGMGLGIYRASCPARQGLNNKIKYDIPRNTQDSRILKLNA